MTKAWLRRGMATSTKRQASGENQQRGAQQGGQERNDRGRFEGGRGQDKSQDQGSSSRPSGQPMDGPEGTRRNAGQTGQPRTQGGAPGSKGRRGMEEEEE